MDITKSGSILCLYKRFEKMAFMPMIPTPLCFVMVIVSTLIIPCGIYVCHFKNIQNKRFITHLVLTHLRKVSSRLNAIKVNSDRVITCDNPVLKQRSNQHEHKFS